MSLGEAVLFYRYASTVRSEHARSTEQIQRRTMSAHEKRGVVSILESFGIILFILFLAGVSSAQENCLTPTRRLGTCINIRNCSSLVEILRRPRPLPQADLDFLRKSQCGFDNYSPKVCCEKTVVPLIEPVTELTRVPTETPPDVTNHPNLRLLEHNLCGPITEGKIFGGNKTGVFDFPWMALIAYQTSIGPEFRCGGSLINKRYVLTAAHCVTELPSGLVLNGVRLGDHDIGKERDCDKDDEGLEVVCAERYQDFGIESSHFFPAYSKTVLQNDIALLRLDNDADLRPPSVRPICLPIGIAATISQKKVTVTGWGATELGPRSQNLLRVLLSIVPNDECAETYRRNTRIWQKQICAGGRNRMDSCLGDSGGPLQAPSIYNANGGTRNVKYVQYGIVSFGPTNCGIEGFPGVYTRVAWYLDWILDTMRD